METKVCNKCHEHKSVIEFTKDHRSRDGRNGTCKMCSNNKNRVKYEEIVNINGEIWADVKSYVGQYMVSNYGRVKSVDRYIHRNDRIQFYQGKLLKIHQRENGYLYVVFVNKMIDKKVLVHRIVAESFIPNVENAEQVNHINGIKCDNKVVNLEWVTRNENIKHAISIGLFHKNIGEENYKSKLRNQDVIDIRRLYQSGLFTYLQLSKQYNVSKSVIIKVIKRKSWKHVA